MSKKSSNDLPVAVYAVRRRRLVLVAIFVGLLALALWTGARMAVAEAATAVEKAADDGNRLLDPEEGRHSYARRLRHAELTKPGHVADADGAPIAGATVKQDGSSWSATTDASGAFALPEMKQGDSVQLNISAPGFLPFEHMYLYKVGENQYNMPDKWPIRLSRPATLSGRVLGPNGKPLAGAPLGIYIWTRNCSTVNQCQATTGADGRFTMTDIPPGSHVVYYPGEAAGSLPAKGVYGSLIVEPTDGQKLKDLTIDLSQSTASVEGQVLGPDGKPMPGAKVTVCRYHEWNNDSNGNRSGGTGPYAIVPATDAEGRYKLTGIGPGNWDIRPSHAHYQRPSPQQRLSLVAMQAVHQNLRVTERNDTENSISLAAAQAERSDDLNQLARCTYGIGGMPAVDRELASSGYMVFMSLAPGQIDQTRVQVKEVGLPRTAKPEEVARAGHIGEFYFVAPDKIVTINGTIVAPFAPPANGVPQHISSWIGRMKRAELVEQVDASRRKTPDGDGRRVTVAQNELYLVVRNDGKAFAMHINDVGANGLNLSFMYIGRLQLGKTPAAAKPKPVADPKKAADPIKAVRPMKAIAPAKAVKLKK